MTRFLPCKTWKTISLSAILFFCLNQTGVYAAGVGSVFFSFPDEWQKAKEKEIESKREIEGAPARVEKKQRKSSPFRSKPKNFMDWRLSGNVLNRAYFDTVVNDEFEGTYALHSWYTVENKIRFPRHDVAGFVSFDARGDIAGNGKSRGKFVPLLQEAYIEAKRSGLRVRLGRQDITWGKLDDFTLLDIVNPQDYTESLLIDKQTRKIPVLMAKIDYFAGNGQYVETFFAPWFKPNKIDFFGSDWAIFSYLKEDTEKGNYTQAIKDMVDGIRIEDGDELDNSLANFETGVRFGGRSRDYDYSFYYMYIHERVPTLNNDSGLSDTIRELLYNPSAAALTALAAAGPTTDDLKLNANYNRMHVLGGDFETTIGELGVRGEIGLFLSPGYLTNDFSLTERSTMSVGIGIDHITADDLYLNFQFIEDIILNYEGLYGAEQFGHQLVGTVSKEFLRGKLVPAFYFGYNFSYKDYFMNPKISYTFSGPAGAFILTAGAFFFEGKPNTVLGRYDKNDLFYTEAEYKF
ncbi:MAG: hypothetical protein NG740_07120 [Omnitrophica bacterium]|nr:hypothetical protein [Candidatus Omnitrophota bacterium]